MARQVRVRAARSRHCFLIAGWAVLLIYTYRDIVVKMTRVIIDKVHVPSGIWVCARRYCPIF